MADEERQDQPEGQEPEATGAPGEPGEAAAEEGPAAPEEGGEAAAEEGAAASEQGGEAAPEEGAAAPEQGGEAAPEESAPAPEEGGEGAAAPEEGGEAAPEESADSAAGDDAADRAPAGEGAAGDTPPEPSHEAPEAGAEQPRRRGRGRGKAGQEEVIPGAHLEPDLVLEEQREGADGDEYGEAGAAYADDAPVADEEPVAEREAAEQPVAREPLDLAADARYAATGKRKTAVARVILRPGDGAYTINGRHLDQFFPRVRLQRMAQQPLETAGYNGRMDVVARIHGGGVSAQAGALRHGIARALVEADPNLRVELKRRGFLTRDPREKERKKAGLKKARKRPQFSKR